uniref:Platelet glycoprotein 4 n=1 Tax=Stegastes partitus TaxID=144197 RepID=A0A3B5AAG5_9TELE
MGCCNRRRALIAGAVFGAVVAILGGILIPVGDIIIEGTVEKEAVIEPGTTAYDNWMSSGSAVYRQFWLFDLKNPVEVLEYGSPPVVMEKGPYTYKTRYLPKENVTFNPNHTASFLLPVGAIFEPTMSVGSEEDMVTSLNLAVAVSVRANILIKSTNSSLFQHRSVKEMLWGYPDPILKETLGLFSPYNGTYDGTFNVFTGKDDISKVGIIDRWKGEKKLSFWNDTYCDMLNGTGMTFHPELHLQDILIIMSVSASYEETVNLKGIDVYRYSLLPSTLASPVDNPDNHCFCRSQEVTKNCTVAGVLDLGSCQDGQPIYISLPHFLHGSKSLLTAVKGLNPNEEEHKTFLDVEPTTGFTLNFAKRIQVNMMYGPSNVITVLKKVKDYTIFPLVWMNETAMLDDATAEMFKKELISRIEMLEIIQEVLLGAGVAIFVVCLISYFVVRSRNNNQSKLA